MRLLEVVIDEHQTPFWKARCLQTGNLLTVALDGLVQTPTAPVPSNAATPDYHRTYRRRRMRKRVVFLLGSILLAGGAFAFREEIMVILPQLRETLRAFLPDWISQ